MKLRQRLVGGLLHRIRQPSLPIPLVFVLMVGGTAGILSGITIVSEWSSPNWGFLLATLLVIDLVLLGLAGLVALHLVRRTYLPVRRLAQLVASLTLDRINAEEPPRVDRDLQEAVNHIWVLGRDLIDFEQELAARERALPGRERELKALAQHWEHQHGQARGLIELIAELSQALGTRAVLERLCGGLSRFFAGDAVAIWIRQPTGELRLAIQVAAEFPATLNPANEWVHAVLSGAMRPLPARATGDVASSIAAPLVDARGAAVGIVALTSIKRRGYTAEEQVLLRAVIGHAALAFQNASAYDQTDALSRLDALTGLQNRREFDRLLPIESERARRYQQPLSLLMIDIDHFKQVNDLRGHPAGDWALQQVGKLIDQTRVRSSDSAFRVGGEEFAILLTQTDKAGALAVAERLRARAEAMKVFADGAGVTISVGVASFPADAPDVSQLTRSADQALYEAKHAGRNRVCAA